MAESSEDARTIIGIDLGTTYSCVAISEKGTRQVIFNEQGKRVTPSFISFSEDELLIGDPAKAHLQMYPENTIYDAKRLIGRRFNDIEVQQNIKRWPFRILEVDKQVKYCVKFRGEEITLYPEEVCAHLLRNLKHTAEVYLGRDVNDAVITVPAYFNDSQRKATKTAGKIAGLNVVRIINEPTAAALAYGLHRKTEDLLNILVYDLGGGTFDVSILSIEGGIFNVKSTAGNTHLGGQDFTNRLVDYCCKDIKSQIGIDVTENKSALANLMTTCDEAKKALSFQKATKIIIVEPDFKYSTTVTQAFFEELNSDLIDLTISCVEKTLKDAKLSVSDIDEIVLVGGSTRIPKVRTMLQEYFNGKTLNFSVNPDEGVAIGAAIQAAIMNGEDDHMLKDVLLLDVTPLTLGINSRGMMSIIIPRNTSIPAAATKEYETVEDDQEFVLIKVYEGEKHLVKHNNLLDEFSLENLPPGPRSTIIIKVIFSIDVNGILTVSAVETSKGIEKTVVVQNKLKNLTELDIIRAIKEAERFKKVGDSQNDIEIVKENLEEFCAKLLYDFDNNKVIASKVATPLIIQECKNILEWCSTNENAKKSEYEKKLNVIKTIYTLNVEPVGK